MKLFKMLGLAAVTAMAAMAFLGASSASANEVVLCKAKEVPCTGGNLMPNGQKIVGGLESPQQAILSPKGGFVNVSCQNSLVEMETKQSQSTQGSQLEGQVTKTEWTACKDQFNNDCTATAIQLNWQAKVSEEVAATQMSTLKVEAHSNPNNGSPAGAVTCSGVTCTYGTTSAELTVRWGAAATATANIQLFEKVPKALCPSEATWAAEYHISSPDPIWATHKNA